MKTYKEFNFILDPCTTSDNPLKTKYFFIKEDDGLTQSWNFKGAVFCNPPYGKFIKYWVKKSYQDYKRYCPATSLVDEQIIYYGFNRTLCLPEAATGGIRFETSICKCFELYKD